MVNERETLDEPQPAEKRVGRRGFLKATLGVIGAAAAAVVALTVDSNNFVAQALPVDMEKVTAGKKKYWDKDADLKRKEKETERKREKEAELRKEKEKETELKRQKEEELKRQKEEELKRQKEEELKRQKEEKKEKKEKEKKEKKEDKKKKKEKKRKEK